MASDTVLDKLVGRLRKFLRDHDELNKLFDSKESSDPQLKMALEDALDDWNNTAPLLNAVTFDTHPSQRLLIRGAAIEVLISAGLWHSRNRLSYSDGGITVSIHDKAQEYGGWIGQLNNNYERNKLALKKALNIEGGWGGMPSEYSCINWY